ncbi:hypothetical protein DFJ73DRAFT_765267 [Zopfochytrium polystomum]|nr:hypothetical protein DFJ73DRAFT_765267 [Zopfochytrium polystomum]
MSGTIVSSRAIPPDRAPAPTEVAKWIAGRARKFAMTVIFEPNWHPASIDPGAAVVSEIVGGMEVLALPITKDFGKLEESRFRMSCRSPPPSNVCAETTREFQKELTCRQTSRAVMERQGTSRGAETADVLCGGGGSTGLERLRQCLQRNSDSRKEALSALVTSRLPQQQQQQQQPTTRQNPTSGQEASATSTGQQQQQQQQSPRELEGIPLGAGVPGARPWLKGKTSAQA